MQKDIKSKDITKYYGKKIQKLTNIELFTLLENIYNDNISKEKKIIYNNYIFCKKCNTHDKIVEDMEKGIILCTGCGLIFANIIDNTPEWRSFENNNIGHSRCSYHTNHFLPQSSLGTSISGMRKTRVKTLHTWSAMPYKERSLNIVLKEIQSRCRKGYILKCIEDEAKILYKNISECKHIKGKNQGKNIITRGDNRKSLIAACVFYACKRIGKTRSPIEIAKLFNLECKDITRGCKIFLKLIKIKKMEYILTPSLPEHFIPRFCKVLNIKEKFIDLAIKITKNISKLNIATSHTPLSVAVASILLMININNIPIKKIEIAKKFGVSEITMTKTYRKLIQYKNILIDDEKTNKLKEMIEEIIKEIGIPMSLLIRYEKILIQNKNIEAILNIENKINIHLELINKKYQQIITKHNLLIKY